MFRLFPLMPACAFAALAALTDDQVITRRFPLTAGGPAPEVVVSLIHGSIHVTAHTAAEIALDAKAHLEASDAARLATLKTGVRLESEQAGQNVWIGVEVDENRSTGDVRRTRRELGWRANAGTRRAAGERSGEDRDYSRFRHEVTLRVPRGAHLKLRTVNGGEIKVAGVEGQFDISNVNGAVTLDGVGGFGRAHTVNGPVTVKFAAQPTGEVSARTVNGAIGLGFPRGLNASLKLRTQHGEITTDFPLTALASAAAEQSAPANGMKRIWRSGPASTLRAGNGSGPAVEAHTVNGAIRILENKD